MDYQKQINKLRASAVQLATLPHGRSNSFTEEAIMEEILILLTEADRLESLKNKKVSVYL
jgi:hypothetical protein